MDTSVYLKLLAYADDLLIALRAPQDWAILKQILTKYSQASNTKMNLMKTTMLSLTGEAYTVWTSDGRRHPFA
jgi:hypothetical protein